MIDSQVSQQWRELEPKVDLNLLANDLNQLKARIEEVAKTPESEAARQQISSAEEAARQGNGPKMLSALRGAGRMFMDFAIATGSGLAVEVIKKANGM